MDNHDHKRADQIGKMLATSALAIHAILADLDDIRLSFHFGEADLRERISEDYLMVARDILPTVEAPSDLLSIVRTALMDWIVLSDLVSLSQAAGLTRRHLDTMEEVAERLAALLSMISSE
jgi:hypothetical protein